MNDLEYFLNTLHKKRQRLDAIAGWHIKAFEQAGIDLPYTPDDTWINVTVSTYNRDTKKYDYDLEASRKKIAAIAKFASKQVGVAVTKNYAYDEFELKIVLSSEDEFDEIRVTYSTKREAVCTKKVVGTEEIPERVTPAHTREVVEWECEDVSLLKIASEA